MSSGSSLRGQLGWLEGRGGPGMGNGERWTYRMGASTGYPPGRGGGLQLSAWTAGG